MLQCILMEWKGNKKMCWKGMGSGMFGELLLREKSYQPKILLLFIEGASASQRNTYVERRSDVETAPSINSYNSFGW